MRLPKALDDLTGLRAARWVRESTRGQYDTFGPEAQREQQDRAIERYGLIETGLSWTVAHSGRTVGDTAQFHDMLSCAGTGYDVLVGTGLSGQHAAARLEESRLTARKVTVFPENVSGRERRMAAQIDFAHRCEPAEVESGCVG